MHKTEKRPILTYTETGYVFISPGDNPDRVVDALLDTGYDEEFCLALDFDPPFIAELMAAGFLVMSAELGGDEEDEDEIPPENAGDDKTDRERRYVLLPKLHLIRSALFFPELHIKKSIGPLLKRYELRFDADFDRILKRCVDIHGEGWLTRPLQDSLRAIRRGSGLPVRPVSFGVYRDGELRAGEFGVAAGRVYTSYSGYYDEDNAGTVQMVLMSQYLRDQGF
ncbi:MAG: GNAT family N-acetyltransferase, partial [Treponema sp.]|nr:GNAT family N-acetyltransferase [Treponema sp.]